MASEVVVYLTDNCPYCKKACELLDSKLVHYTRVRVDLDPAKRQEMEIRSGRHTVPQIFIAGHHVGGCDDLYELEEEGMLDALLGVPSAGPEDNPSV